MPGGEIIPPAQRGVIDCAEWVGGVEDLRLGFHNVWKYHYTPGMHENIPIGELVFNMDVWKSLPPQQQEMIKIARQRRPSSSGGRSGRSRTPTRIEEMQRSTACGSCARRPTS